MIKQDLVSYIKKFGGLELSMALKFGLSQAVDLLIIICKTGTEKKLGMYFMLLLKLNECDFI